MTMRTKDMNDISMAPRYHHDETSPHTHDGGPLPHEHEHGGSAHRHQHTQEENKAILDRLARAIGHLESVRRMVADGRDCSEVLIQLSAVKAALNKTGLQILQNHMERCVVEAAQSGDMEVIAELNKAMSMYFK